MLGISACSLKFNLKRAITHFFIPNIYNFIYYGLVIRFCGSLKDQKMKKESKRIAHIWKQMLITRKLSLETGVFDGNNPNEF